MSYHHSYTAGEENGPLDSSVEDFAIITEFTIDPALPGIMGVPRIIRKHFCIWSDRANLEGVEQRGLSPANDIADKVAQTHTLDYLGGGKRKIGFGGVRLKARVKQQSAAERQSLCLWANTSVQFSGWGGAQPVIQGPHFTAQNVHYGINDLGIPYHIYSRENGSEQTERLGICRPLSAHAESFTSLILATAANNLGMPEIVFESGGSTTKLFAANTNQPAKNVNGFVLVLAGAFAPVSYQACAYDLWQSIINRIPAAVPHPDAEDLFRLAQAGKKRRSQLTQDERDHAPGTTAPAEVLYLTGVGNANAGVLLA